MSNATEPRVLGCGERLTGPPQVSRWTPMTRQQVEALPPLPEPPGRPPLARPAPEPVEAEAAEAARPAGPPEAAPPPRVRPPRPEHLVEGSARALAWEQPEDAAMVLRAMLMESGGRETASQAARQAGIVVLALGQEVAAEVLRHLSDFELEEIGHAVASLKGVSAEACEAELEEFGRHLQAGQWARVGGLDYARQALERGVGPRRAREIMDRVSSSLSSGFHVLKNVAPEQVAPFISHEHPQTIALILSQLEAGQAAGILAQLPEAMQGDVACRIATMENVPPAVLKELEGALEATLRDVLGGNRDVGGPRVLAPILNLTGSSIEKRVLDALDERNAGVAEATRNSMFTWDDVGKLADRDLQTFLRAVEESDLVMALKATHKAMQDKILANMSESLRGHITEEVERLGPMRLREVETVQLRLVHLVRQLEEEGRITIARGVEHEDFV